MSKPVIPEGRTGTPNVAGLRRTRLSKAPDQDFVVQVATRDENALRLVPDVPADPSQQIQDVPQQAPAPAPQQTPAQALPQAPEQAHQQTLAPAAQQAPAQAFQQPPAAPQETQPPAPAVQQPVQAQAPAPGAPAPQSNTPAAAPAKPQTDEPPRKKKENYLQDWDDAARVRRSFNRTKHITGIENWSEFVSRALLEKAAQLEAQYNEGQPFDGSTKAPMGRPAAAE